MEGAGTILLATNDNSGGVTEVPVEIGYPWTCDSGSVEGRWP